MAEREVEGIDPKLRYWIFTSLGALVAVMLGFGVRSLDNRLTNLERHLHTIDTRLGAVEAADARSLAERESLRQDVRYLRDQLYPRR
jgi:hypothetical protein